MAEYVLRYLVVSVLTSSAPAKKFQLFTRHVGALNRTQPKIGIQAVRRAACQRGVGGTAGHVMCEFCAVTKISDISNPIPFNTSQSQTHLHLDKFMFIALLPKGVCIYVCSWLFVWERLNVMNQCHMLHAIGFHILKHTYVHTTSILVQECSACGVRLLLNPWRINDCHEYIRVYHISMYVCICVYV